MPGGMKSLALSGLDFPLHTGTAFGMPGRIVIAAAGVGLVAMILTGFYVWLIKWRMRRRVFRPSWA